MTKKKTKTRQSSEVKRVLEDRNYWQGFIKNEDWYLIGFTYKNSALFGSKSNNTSVDLTTGHLDLLGLLPKEK